MPLKIVRNDITKMEADAIVNTANNWPTVGTGCDCAIYQAAGQEELLRYRIEKIGFVPEGEVFLTPGFQLNCKYIIHAVSPKFKDGMSGEEELLRGCYRKSLGFALANGVRSIAFPLISTGGFGYPKEEGFRIAIDEIHAFLMRHEMLIYLVVFGEETTRFGKRLDPKLKSYIDQNYVEQKGQKEYFGWMLRSRGLPPLCSAGPSPFPDLSGNKKEIEEIKETKEIEDTENTQDTDKFYKTLGKGIKERMRHLSDTFSEYLIYLIDSRGMTYPEVYKRAIVDKKVFSKIKNNPDSHPKKMTAMCLCIGAKLNLDQSKDLLARAGYALSPCDKTDIIFSYFIENEIYDMIELDICLEEYGLPCLIS